MSSIASIVSKIENFFSKIRVPALKLPNFLIYCAAITRPGLSAQLLASEIIRDKGLLGIPIGKDSAGGENLDNQVEYIRQKDTIRAIKTTGVVTGVAAPGTIRIMSFGANAGGPFFAEGFNMGFVPFRGKLD